ncbi:LysE family translocator [Leeia oryzae]|uniref:LysE family translocator n=1 Tax=Leeia oryzae TaxID=356662 RepID=UPI0003A125A5|nr:LysE family translocator [Leeia oryzae]
MLISHALILFTLTAALLTITPGLDTALVMSTSMRRGGRSGWVAGLGVCVGCLLWGLLVALGLGALLEASGKLYQLLKMAGALYLIYIAIQLWRRKESTADVESTDSGLVQQQSDMQLFRQGLLTNLLNPKIGIFYVTFLPQFIPPHVNVTAFSVLLASIHAIEGMLWFGLLAMLVGQSHKKLDMQRWQKPVDKLTAVVFMLFGGKLLWDK